MDHLHSTRTSYLWLVVVPTATAASAWLALFAPVDRHPTGTYLTLLSIPLVGVVAVLAHARAAGEWTRLWPLAPYALCAVVFLGSTWDLALAVAREPGGAFIPIVPLGTGLLLPLAALAGGLLSVALPRSRA